MTRLIVAIKQLLSKSTEAFDFESQTSAKSKRGGVFNDSVTQTSYLVSTEKLFFFAVVF